VHVHKLGIENNWTQNGIMRTGLLKSTVATSFDKGFTLNNKVLIFPVTKFKSQTVLCTNTPGKFQPKVKV